MSKPRIAVVGSINLDLVARCEALPDAGETVLGTRFSKYPGGKGANQALAARRLGAEVAMMGRVGVDSEANSALELLDRDGVDLTRCRPCDGVPTGVALIAVDRSGDNHIVVAPGANALLDADDLPHRIDGAVILQLEVPLAVVEAAAARCEGLVVMNLAPYRPVSDTLLSRADLIVVNEGEAKAAGLDRLFASGGLLAVTLGARGAVLFRDGSEVARAVPPPVVPVDATGAGDTFVAALTIAVIEQMSPERALDFACAAAALSTETDGAQVAMPYRRAVDAILGGR